MKRGELSRCSPSWRYMKQQWEFYFGQRSRRQIVCPPNKWKNATFDIVVEQWRFNLAEIESQGGNAIENAIESGK